MDLTERNEMHKQSETAENLVHTDTSVETGRTQAEITRSGNPGKPQGEDGNAMLLRMNDSHYAVTGWGLEHWQIRGNEQILDIGCGGGATLKRMSEKVTTGHLTGVDYSSVSVKTSKEVNDTVVAAGKMEVMEGSVADLPFPAETFDKIITVESFYFWPDPQENLKEVFRVLKRGGTFLLLADVYGRDDLPEAVVENINRFHLFNPTLKEFRNLFERAGFAEIHVHEKEGTTWVCVEGHK